MQKEFHISKCMFFIYKNRLCTHIVNQNRSVDNHVFEYAKNTKLIKSYSKKLLLKIK